MKAFKGQKALDILTVGDDAPLLQVSRVAPP